MNIKCDDYTESVKKIFEVLNSHAQQARHCGTWPGFQQWEVPGDFHQLDVDISNCRGYKHVKQTKSQCQGFFFKGHMTVQEEEAFKEWDILCNEITAAAFVSTPQ